jgi:hypothetical protein
VKGYDAEARRQHKFCDACHRPMWFDAKPDAEPPRICAKQYCMAWLNWGDEQWRWRARQAALTASMGVAANDFDTEALRRFPQPVP